MYPFDAPARVGAQEVHSPAHGHAEQVVDRCVVSSRLPPQHNTACAGGPPVSAIAATCAAANRPGADRVLVVWGVVVLPLCGLVRRARAGRAAGVG